MEANHPGEHLAEELKAMGMWEEWATGKRGRVE